MLERERFSARVCGKPVRLMPAVEPRWRDHLFGPFGYRFQVIVKVRESEEGVGISMGTSSLQGLCERRRRGAERAEGCCLCCCVLLQTPSHLDFSTKHRTHTHPQTIHA